MKFLIFLTLVSTVFAVTDQDFAKLTKKVEDVTRQLMLTELAIGERARADYDSGIKQVRVSNDGTKSYFTSTHTYNSVCSIHEHSNYDRTVGMGEFIATLNGVEFRTRHNDYKLRMPSRTSKDYNKQDEIPFPPVPPTVLSKPTLQEQIHEMQNYFRAFAFQNHNFRDYRPYFKPVLCYLEGAWTTDTKTLNEPFQSDRHSIDADSWFDLQEKIRFTSYTGGKHYLENFSYLPTTIMNLVNGSAEFAQWNYRISCHPIKRDLPLSSLKPVDDIAARVGHKMNLTRFSHTRAARFTLAPHINIRKNHFKWTDGYGEFKDSIYHNGLLDQLMNEIPGKDNYLADLRDTSFGMETLDPRSINSTALNTGFYHRYFKHDKKGAMGIKTVSRGFSDRNLFVAQTSNPHVAAMKIHYCRKQEHSHHKICQTDEVRYTYAIPLEIIYMTPLFSWNPYNLPFIPRSQHRRVNEVALGGRNGGLTVDKAYNGTAYRYFYRTPVEFFHGTNVDKDKADTDRGAVGVIDGKGAVKRVVSSGQRITLPDIPGVGKLRLRYPVMPVTKEGSQVGKDIDALKELLNHLETMGGYLEERPSALSGGGNAQADAHFRTSVTNQDPPGHHFHELYIDHEDMTDLANGLTVSVITTTDNSHSHQLEVSFDQKTHKYIIHKCDGRDHCWDGHSEELTRMD